MPLLSVSWLPLSTMLTSEKSLLPSFMYIPESLAWNPAVFLSNRIRNCEHMFTHIKTLTESTAPHNLIWRATNSRILCCTELQHPLYFVVEDRNSAMYLVWLDYRKRSPYCWQLSRSFTVQNYNWSCDYSSTKKGTSYLVKFQILNV